MGGRASILLPDTAENRNASLPEGVDLALSSTGTIDYVKTLRHYCRRWRPDYVHFLNPSRKAALFRIREPGAKMIGDWEDWHVHLQLPTIQRTAVAALDAFNRKTTQLRITCSQWLQSEFQRRGLANVEYIPYGVSVREQVDSNYSPFTEKTAVFMGAINVHWDLDILFDAMRILALRGKHPKLEVIGKGPELERWQHFAAQNNLPNITFAGYLADESMEQHLRSAHVLLFPIRPTAWNRARCPYKAFLYAAAKRPIITCKVGEVAALLGDRATYVEPDPASFACGIEHAMAQSYTAEVNYCLEEHAWDKRADQFIDFIARER